MFRAHLRLTLASSLVLAALSLPLRAQSAANPSGHWEGTIQVPDKPVGIEIDLAKSGGAELAGTFSIVGQLERGLPLANIVVGGRTVSMVIKGTSGGTFDGVFSADGKSISGQFNTTKGGYSIPFILTRTGEPRIEAPAKIAAIGKEMEGTWSGTLDVNGIQKRLVLTMSNHPDGTVTGTIGDGADGLEVPITNALQKGSGLTVEVKPVVGSFSGTLNAQGTELVGTWTQGALVLPLTFRRAVRQ